MAKATGVIAMFVVSVLARGARVAGTTTLVCKPGHVKCHSHELCLPPERQCDGYRDCNGESEEDYCTECIGGAMRCDGHRCVATEYLCDGYKNCNDGADEKGCLLNDIGLVHCANSYSQVSARLKCDGVRNCPHGEDEQNCKECRRGAYKCRPLTDTVCLPAVTRCNGVADCIYGLDERSCPEQESNTTKRVPTSAGSDEKASQNTTSTKITTSMSNSTTTATFQRSSTTYSPSTTSSNQVTRGVAYETAGSHKYREQDDERTWRASERIEVLLIVVTVVGLMGAGLAWMFKMRRRFVVTQTRRTSSEYAVTFFQQDGNSTGSQEKTNGNIAPLESDG